MSFLDNYETVDVRLKRFIEDFKDSRVSITTELVDAPEQLKGIVFKCTVEVCDLEGNVVYKSTGWANEVPGDGAVNRDSVLENCETSAVGRALANLGYSGSKRPSAEEMKKVGKNSYAQASKPTVKASSNGEVLMPFGDFKGHDAKTVPLHQLKWAVDVVKKNLADPAKEGFKEPNEKALKDLEPIYLQRVSEGEVNS
jgi:hypothetical protein